MIRRWGVPLIKASADIYFLGKYLFELGDHTVTVIKTPRFLTYSDCSQTAPKIEFNRKQLTHGR